MRREGLVLVALLGLAAPATALVDNEVRPPVNYFILVPPAVGESYHDPVFGTPIRRMSDTRNQPNSADTGYLAFIVNEYSTMSPFNADNSRILLQHQGYFALYDGAGRYQADLPFDIAASTEPRWSRQDANLLYYLYGNSLKRYDVAARTGSVMRTFAEYSRVSGRGESDICFDGDHFVLVGDDHDIFVYELSTGQKGPVLNATGHGFDSVYIAPGDQVLVNWYQPGPGRYAGIELYDRDMNFLRQLAPVGSHMDVGRDTDGQGVLLWINASDPEAPPSCPNAVVKIRLADGQRTCLLPLDWSLALHISAPDAGGWFFVSTYAPSDPNPLEGGWRPYTGEILQVRLDGSEVRRLAHHRSRPFNDYNYTPRAAVSRDGSRLVYSSNYGLPAILGYASYYSDAYMLEVPSTAPSSYLGSTSPIRTRYEQDHSSVSYSGPWISNSQAVLSGGSAALATDMGAWATFAFSGTAVRWIGFRDEWAGIGRVYVDGQPRSIVDSYRSPSAAQSSLFSASALAPGSHTLEIEVTGTRNPLSAGSWVWLDALETAARTEQGDDAVTFTGTWETDEASWHSGGSVARSGEPGAQAMFHFAGTAVSWIGYRGPGSGIARISIDGIVRADIDTYAPAPVGQAIVYTLSALPPGEHTLTVESTGRRHPLSSGDWISVDAFETLPGEP